MKKRLLIAGLVVLLALSAFVTIGSVRAHSLVALKATQAYADHMGDLRSAFSLTRSVIGSGGMGGSVDGYTIHSTLGQPVAGSISGGDYTLTSGFWGQALMAWFNNFLPLILR